MFLTEPQEGHLVRAAIYIARRLNPQLPFEELFSLVVSLKAGTMEEAYEILHAGIELEYALDEVLGWINEDPAS